MKLNEIADNPGARHKFKRIGRGIGSGKGKTSGRGGKGQTARSGVAINGFEGGQTPLHRRLPKRGFKNPGRLSYQIINLSTLQSAVESGKIAAGSLVTAASLKEAGVISQVADGIRLLGKGAIATGVTVEVAGASKSAVDAVEKAGGRVIVRASATEETSATPAAGEGTSEAV